MSYRRLLVLYALILILVVAQTISLGEESHGNSTGGRQSSVERPTAEAKLGSKIIKEMVKLFPMFTEATFADRYSARLPKGLEGIARGSEDDIADVIAEIFGTLNDAQVDKLITDVEEMLKAKPESEDDRNLEKILKRLKEASLSVKKKAGDSELAKFREAFESKFTKVREKNKEFYKLLNDALTNDAAKRKLMAEGYDPDYLLPWWREQCATGNNKLCNDLGKGVTFKDETTGDQFIDVVNGDNKKGRLVIPSGQQFADAVADLSDQSHGFSKLKVSPTKHETLDEQPVRARPRAATQPAPPRPRPQGTGTPQTPAQPSPPARPDPTATPSTPSAPTTRPSPQPSQPSAPSAAEQLRTKDAEVGQAVIAKCFKCHGPTVARPRGGFAFNADGTVKGTRVSSDGNGSVQRVVARALTDADMPPASQPQLTDAEKQAIRDWGRLQGVE